MKAELNEIRKLQKLAGILTESFIDEAKQVGTIYHYTTYKNAVSIIDQDKLIADHTNDATNSNPKYAISFTRNKNFASTQRTLLPGTPRVRFIVDGDKLSNKYKIEPYAQKGFEKSDKNSFEAEERIVYGKPFSVKLSDYLIGIDIVKELKDPGKYEYDFDWDMFGEDQKKLIELCQSKNIKVNIIDQNGNSIPFKQSKEKKSFFSKLFNR
jgi:hypothetical protein